MKYFYSLLACLFLSTASVLAGETGATNSAFASRAVHIQAFADITIISNFSRTATITFSNPPYGVTNQTFTLNGISLIWTNLPYTPYTNNMGYPLLSQQYVPISNSGTACAANLFQQLTNSANGNMGYPFYLQNYFPSLSGEAITLVVSNGYGLNLGTDMLAYASVAVSTNWGTTNSITGGGSIGGSSTGLTLTSTSSTIGLTNTFTSATNVTVDIEATGFIPGANSNAVANASTTNFVTSAVAGATNGAVKSFIYHLDTGNTNFYTSPLAALQALSSNCFNTVTKLAPGVATLTWGGGVTGGTTNIFSLNGTNFVVDGGYIGHGKSGFRFVVDNSATIDTLGSIIDFLDCTSAVNGVVENLELEYKIRTNAGGEATNLNYQWVSYGPATNLTFYNLHCQGDFYVTNAPIQHTHSFAVGVSYPSSNVKFDSCEVGWLEPPGQAVYYNLGAQFYIGHGGTSTVTFVDCVEYGLSLDNLNQLDGSGVNANYVNMRMVNPIPWTNTFGSAWDFGDLTNATAWIGEQESQTYYLQGTDTNFFGYDQYSNQVVGVQYPANSPNGLAMSALQPGGVAITNGQTTAVTNGGGLFVSGGLTADNGTTTSTFTSGGTVTALTGFIGKNLRLWDSVVTTVAGGSNFAWNAGQASNSVMVIDSSAGPSVTFSNLAYGLYFALNTNVPPSVVTYYGGQGPAPGNHPFMFSGAASGTNFSTASSFAFLYSANSSPYGLAVLPFYPSTNSPLTSVSGGGATTSAGAVTLSNLLVNVATPGTNHLQVWTLGGTNSIYFHESTVSDAITMTTSVGPN